MEKFKQKLRAIWEVLMDRGVLYNVKVKYDPTSRVEYSAVRGNAITVVGYSQL